MEKITFGLKHEQIVLGSILRDHDVRKKLTRQLTIDDFANPKHKTIFAGLQALTDAGLEYTPGSLVAQLGDGPWGGKEYLDKLEGIGQGQNLDHHIDKMRWDRARVQCFSEYVPHLVATLKDPRAPAEDASAYVNRIQETIRGARGQQFYEHGASLASRYSASIDARKIHGTFRSSGFRALDELLVAGFAAGDISVITGAPSMGKTTFALNLTKKQSKKWHVGYIPWEGGIQAALDIICASRLRIPLENIIKFTHLIENEQQAQIDDYLAELLGDDKMSFLKRPPRNLLQGQPWDVNNKVLDWFEGQLEGWNRQIVYWDLFEKCLAGKKPDQISQALDRVQDIAKRTGVHICLLHQITFKEVERRKDMRPTRDSLKGTGGYVEVADLIFGLFRPAIYEIHERVADATIEVICLKQRKGRFPWKVIFDWEGECGRVYGGSKPMPVITEDADRDSYDDGI
jgi:replicative DNA helicase